MFFRLSEIISIVDILINIILVLFIAHFIQRNQTNSRTLKDYFIKEVDKIHEEISNYLDSLEGNLQPKSVNKWFTSRAAKINNIINAINSKYGINSMELVSDLICLQGIIESDVNFTRNFRMNSTTRLTNASLDEIQIYRSQKVKIFHEIITKINDHNKSIL
jgi:hypothetical protein